MNLITQVKAAEIAGVSKQAINGVKAKKVLKFFVGKKVDTDHTDWTSYMHERSCNNASPVKQKKPVKNDSKIENGIDPVQKKPEDKEINPDRESDRQKYSLTGGWNVNNFVPENIADVKRLTEIERLKLEMEVRLGGLIEREMVVNILDTLNQNIRGHFVDLARRVSERICAKLEKVGLEKEVEKIIGPYVEKGIQTIKKEIKKSLKIKLNGK